MLARRWRELCGAKLAPVPGLFVRTTIFLHFSFQKPLQIRRRFASLHLSYLRWRPGCYYLPAFVASAGADVDNPIAGGHYVHVMLDYYHSVACFYQAVELL
jgi:hypothetical protein